ncbi:uncharacterized protein YndB with AHSA1/START domain [Hoeflea halophila]|uniref:Uncharacterized protein YndB with AHSA1/START domain n=1 Tax=Hoeflea halophila TaxID=714899 RepID=A0A286HNC3_9HYPH|nr:SRPBCC family protein [Hoeflea halophila]SOE08779.1 uncharacterized protein YndB with AHSA1/START domain [Hoeflea halophila]
MTDRIDRIVMLQAPVHRVWKALTDAKEFAAWFRLELHEGFRPGEITRGVTAYPGHEGLPFWLRVEAMEEPKRFSFTWPYDEMVVPEDPDLESKTTLVEFTLEAEGGGTRLTLRESGFENLPEARRLQAFRDNEGGWTLQMGNLKAHVE